MPIIPIAFGEGLKRADGIMTRPPNTFEDLREVILYAGKAQNRKGLLDVGTILPGNMIVDLSPMRWENAAMAATYATDGAGGGTRNIELTKLAIDGTSPQDVGSFGVLSLAAQYDPPIIVAADSERKLIIAHTEPNFAERLKTLYYDPFNPSSPTADNLFPILADLGAGEEEEIKFRGVTRHLSYIFGWGHGQGNFESSDAVPDRPDVVRVSNSGQPTIFQDFAFFEIGQQGEPVMVCRSAGNALMVFKENETHQIFGYSPDTFGVRMADTLFGCVGERLAVTVGNTVYFWSTQGPRGTQGGESVDIAVPLDIEGPDPVNLAAQSDPKDAFAVYDPENRVVQFVWGKRVYALSIRYPDAARWSYYELGETAQCGSQFFTSEATSGGGGEAPVGGPEIVSVYPHGPDVEFGSENWLTLTSNPLDTETFTIGTTVYTFQTVLTDVDGNVLIGATASDSLDNLIAHIMLAAGAGTLYAASGTIDPLVSAVVGAGDTMAVTQKVPSGAIIPTTDTSVDAGNAWTYDSLIGGLYDGGIGYSVDPRDVTLILDNEDSTGGEFVETYFTMVNNQTLLDEGYQRIDNRAVGAAVQRLTIDGDEVGLNDLLPTWDYDIAVRYQRGNKFDPLWDTSPASTWPAESQASTTLDSDDPILDTRGVNNGIWQRNSSIQQQIEVPITHPPGHEFLPFSIERETSTLGNTADQNVNGDGIGPPDSVNVIQVAFGPLAVPTSPGDTVFIDPAPTANQINSYRIIYNGPTANSDYSNELPCWPGPDGPLPNTFSPENFAELDNAVLLQWMNTTEPVGFVPAGRILDVWSVNRTQSPPYPYDQQNWNPGSGSPPSSGSYAFEIPNVVNNDVARIGIRYVVIVASVTHYSPWAVVTATPNYLVGTLGDTE